ncbi:peptidase S8/S53 domain-containing protein [Syncephalis fuscata]|nr:peptidase S8/S53 domain-containing protein [Syncephalis fuscata]
MKPILLAALLLALATNDVLAQVKAQVPSQPPTVFAPATNVGTIDNVFMIYLDDATQQATFRDSLTKLSINFRVRYSLTAAVNAISIDTDSKNYKTINDISGVKSIWPINQIAGPGVRPQQPKKDNPLSYTHGMTGVDVMHKKYKAYGKGVKVGVVDSGIDYMHPALGGCFGPKCRVAYGWDFVGNNFNSTTSSIVQSADPRDTCFGHGTHVAGIIGAHDEAFLGVAPEVTFGAYKVFSCSGDTADDAVIAALDRAYADGMDIVNLSLGEAGAIPQSNNAFMAEILAQKGLIVVASAGNTGHAGLWEVSTPSVAPSAFSVAALDNLKNSVPALALSSAIDTTFTYTLINGIGSIKINATDIVVAGPADNVFGCKPFGPEVNEKVILVQESNCAPEVKSLNAEKAGAAAIIIHKITPGPMRFPMRPDINIDVATVEKASGEAITKSLANNPSQKVLFDKQTIVDVPTAGHLSDFSSWGPSFKAEIKPDIGAPGGFIYSTEPLPMGKYGIRSGTSMAAPYVAGSIALYLQVNGIDNKLGTGAEKVDRTRLHQLFQNTARPATEVKDKTLISSVARQGAGLLNVERAIFGTTLVTPSRLALNDTQYPGNHNGDARNRTVHITNLSKSDRVYTVTHVPAVAACGLDANGLVMSQPETRKAPASVKFSSTHVKIAAGQISSIDVLITPPSTLPEAEKWVYSGYIVFDPATNSNNTPSNDAIYVPYLGIKGRLSDIHVLKQDPTIEMTNRLTNTPIPPLDTTTPYVMTGHEVMAVSYDVEYPSLHAKTRIYDAATKKVVGAIPESSKDNLPRRHATYRANQKFNWYGNAVVDGTNTSKNANLANGVYYFELMVLRPYGDATKNSDYDVWRSPNVMINISKA